MPLEAAMPLTSERPSRYKAIISGPAAESGLTAMTDKCKRPCRYDAIKQAAVPLQTAAPPKKSGRTAMT